MKHALVLGGLIASLLGIGLTRNADACGRGVQHGCAGVPSGHYMALLRDMSDFGHWVTFTSQVPATPAGNRLDKGQMDANIQKHLGGSLNTGVATTSVSRLLTRMHLTRFPVRWTATVLSYTDGQAVERVHWQMRGGHGPLIRLTWTDSVVGWEITDATYLGAR